MFKHQVKDPGAALAYITDCTLATVASMALKKRPPVGEFRRQVEIAKQAIVWMNLMRVDYTGTRAVDVMDAGSVDLWAAAIGSRRDGK